MVRTCHLLRALMLSLLTFSSLNNASEDPIHVYMAGDSTMAIKEVKDYPETGWGMPFSIFFDSGVMVDNRAMNGRSTRTFIEEGRWQSIVDSLKGGDYVFIQFGHNDEVATKVDRYTPPQQFEKNLLRFISDVRAAKAEPILLSPITRRDFNEEGTIQETHKVYSAISRKVAKETASTFIDMDEITRHYFQAQGDEGSALRFMHIPADTHPNYPMGVRDNTHLNQMGAREVAQLVLTELKKMGHPLANRLRIPDPKHLKLSYNKK